MAGNYCSSCSKLVGFETEEPEIQSEDISDGQVHVEVLLKRVCDQCSGDMKEATFELVEDIYDVLLEHEATEHPAESNADLDDSQPKQILRMTYTLECDVSGTERVQTTDRKGKPIKNSRYQKTFFGVQVDYTVKCDGCNKEVHSGGISDEMQASGFDEV